MAVVLVVVVDAFDIAELDIDGARLRVEVHAGIALHPRIAFGGGVHPEHDALPGGGESGGLTRRAFARGVLRRPHVRSDGDSGRQARYRYRPQSPAHRARAPVSVRTGIGAFGSLGSTRLWTTGTPLRTPTSLDRSRPTHEQLVRVQSAAASQRASSSKAALSLRRATATDTTRQHDREGTHCSEKSSIVRIEASLLSPYANPIGLIERTGSANIPHELPMLSAKSARHSFNLYTEPKASGAGSHAQKSRRNPTRIESSFRS